MLLLSDIALLSREIYFAAQQEDINQSFLDSNAYTHALDFVNENVIKKDTVEEGDKDEKTDDDDDDDEDSKDKDDTIKDNKDEAKKDNKDVSKNNDEEAEAGAESNEADENATSRKRSGSKTDLSVAKSINSMKTLTEQFKLIRSDKNKLYDMIGEWEEPVTINHVTVSLLFAVTYCLLSVAYIVLI